MAVAHPRQRFVTLAALRRYLGVSQSTAARWCRLGILRACQVQTRHYTDERARKTSRGRWRIYEPDLIAFLRWYRGRDVPLPHGLLRSDPL